MGQVYQSELKLVQMAAHHLEQSSNAFGNVRLTFEFPHAGGWADIVAVNELGIVLAFEAKLKNWRKALEQAHRCESFADFRYVLLPIDAATSAVEFTNVFLDWGIGLCTIDSSSGLIILVESRETSPLMPVLKFRAQEASGHHFEPKRNHSTKNR